MISYGISQKIKHKSKKIKKMDQKEFICRLKILKIKNGNNQ